jgi:phosphoketolase
MQNVYQTQRQIWTVVLAKYEAVPDLFTLEEATRLLQQGAVRLDWAGYKANKQRLILTAIGGYQLEQVLKASFRLAEHDVAHSVVYMMEPGRFRLPRSEGEQAHMALGELKNELYPVAVPNRIFVVHTRPQAILGVLQPLNTGSGHTVCLGFIGQGGTLTKSGMLFVNRCTWGHILVEAARLLDTPREEFLSSKEIAALDGKANPEGVIV